MTSQTPPAVDAALQPEASSPVDSPAPFHSVRLHFTGQGSEYFRIWVVHLLLMLLTLGLYSPWAKVRKMRWFAQHTLLLGDRFDFHGDARRILRGRLLAFGLLALWSLSFEVSATLGWLALVLMLALGPVLFASAQRFRMGNLSWRGLRFGFSPPVSTVYRVGLPALGLWSLGTALAQLQVSERWVIAGSLLFLAATPFLHARLKRLQHAHAWYGDRPFRFDAGLAQALYGTYLMALMMVLAGGFGGLVLGGLISGAVNLASGGHGQNFWLPWLMAGLAGLGVVTLGYPYLAAHVQQQVWQRTHWGAVRFEGRMQTAALCNLCLRQGLLVLLTAGVYWPWAAVALARYRVQCIAVLSDQPLGEAQAAARAPVRAASAAGDAAGDLFGLDLGW